MLDLSSDYCTARSAPMSRRKLAFVVARLAPLALAAVAQAKDEGRLEIHAVDKTTGKPVSARMHLKDGKGKPVKPQKVPFWKDHFVFDGTIVLELPLGTYNFEMEC